jgi:protein-S-isoprenylcysteine O-methyltransferase Ste14
MAMKWQNKRGEAYVAAQLLLFVLIAFGPPNFLGLPAWPSSFAGPSALLGMLMLLAGALFAGWGVLALGHNLTPLPAPKEDSHLVVNGPYKYARHPIYGGIAIAAFGWALNVQGTFTLLLAAALFVLFDFKASREEAWLRERYANYAAYAYKVKRLIPFLY